ncbi:hypothetical protein Tco_1253172 [Tanacetum coccineum]
MVACCLGFDVFLSWLLVVDKGVTTTVKRQIMLIAVINGDHHFLDTRTIKPVSVGKNFRLFDQLREDIQFKLSIVETDMVNHNVETDMMKLVVEFELFGVNFDEFDNETRSSDKLQPKQAGLNCVHALNKPHLHEIHVVPNKHEADRC